MKIKLVSEDYFIFDCVLLKIVSAHMPSEKKVKYCIKKIYGCECWTSFITGIIPFPLY